MAIPTIQVEVTADTARAEAGLDRVENSVMGVSEQADRARSNVRAMGAQLNTASTQARSYGRAAKVSSAHTGNLAAQFNDIGVMLASGQSPMLLAVQQGTQVNQVLDQVGTNGRDRLRALSSAFTGLVSPANIATLGVIAGGAALVQFGMKAFNAAGDANTFGDKLERVEGIASGLEETTDLLKQSVSELSEEYGQAAERVRDFALAQAEIRAEQAAERLRGQIDLLNNALSDFVAIETPESLITGLGGAEQIRALERLQSELGVTRDQAAILEGQFESLLAAENFDAQQDALKATLSALEDMEVPLNALPSDLQDAIDEMITLSRETDRARELMRQLRGESAGMTTGTPLREEDITLPPTGGGGDDGGGGRGGRSRSSADRMRDQMSRRLEALQEALMTERETVQAWRDENTELLNNALEQELITEQQHRERLLAVEKEYQKRLRGLRSEGYQQITALTQGNLADQLGAWGDYFGNLTDLMGSENNKLLSLQKAFAAGEALINAWRGYNQVLADPTVPWYAKLAAAGSVLAAGLGAVNAIKSVTEGGGGGAGGSAGGNGQGGSQVSAQQPLQVRIAGVQPNDMISGSQLSSLFDRLQDEAGDRGVEVMFAR